MADKKVQFDGIVVDDGSRRVPIRNTNGEEIGAFTFRPTDVGIIERYNDFVRGFDSIMEPINSIDVKEDEDIDLTDPQYAEAFSEATKRLHTAVNALFASDDAAQAFFGKMNPFSPVGGEFYCARVLESVGNFIGSQFDRETLAFSPKARSYAKKAGAK